MFDFTYAMPHPLTSLNAVSPSNINIDVFKGMNVVVPNRVTGIGLFFLSIRFKK